MMIVVTKGLEIEWRLENLRNVSNVAPDILESLEKCVQNKLDFSGSPQPINK